jgi:hypothetical protein
MDAEHERLDEARRGTPWKRWGPYLSERQWGTVREDYSEAGTAWDFFTHDQARSRAYRWGEDGLAGFSDDQQRLCFAVALWNGRDPILKERLFGLTNSEGNHGEDVKEYYFYLDATPTHSYLKYLYRYPLAAYPYNDLVETNGRRGPFDFEYELIDTGVFDQNEYVDVVVEYAKASPEDVLVRITATNRGPEPATLHLLPTLWFRNTWSWGEDTPKPSLAAPPGANGSSGILTILASDAELGERVLEIERVDADDRLLFTENETNDERVSGTPNATPYVKDAFHAYVVEGRTDAVNPAATGTKAASLHRLEIAPGGSAVVRLRFRDRRAGSDAGGGPFGEAFDRTFAARMREADAFHDSIAPRALDEDRRRVMRQALAGMIWSKQFYTYPVEQWLAGHGASPWSDGGRTVRNQAWFHLVSGDVISMPDKWEYPWFAAWDLAFHTVALAMVDIEFAKSQLDLLLHDTYLHPNGQIPAYEWAFGDVNPPVHAWASLFVYELERDLRGVEDIEFLTHAFQKLLVNFTWWVNRKDPAGRNVFEGGFLGLDNIGVFDRSAPLPTGGHLEQADGTAWMALYSQNMFEIALELARHDPSYEHLANKFLQHFLWIGAAMDRIGERDDEMWDEEDGFYYDVLRTPDGRAQRLKVRSLVGLLPLAAVTVVPRETAERFPGLIDRARLFLARHPELLATIHPPGKPGVAGRVLLSMLDETKLRRVLSRMLDESEFLSPHGIRSVSAYHRDHPFGIRVGDREFAVDYEPAESRSGLFGGNSNWRGPIWFPMNAVIIRALLQLYRYYGDDFTIECPTGSGRTMNLFDVSKEIADRLARIFLLDANGRRPVFGGTERFQTDPNWRDLIPFYEYFHGDNGAGLGASHQTGWTGLVAPLMQMYGVLTPASTLASSGSRSSVVSMRDALRAQQEMSPSDVS